MSDTNKTARNMSDAEAKAEHEDIQREIAKSKGAEYKPEETIEAEETKEPEAIEKPEEEPAKEPLESEGQEDTELEDEEIDPDLEPEKPRKKSLVDRFRETKAEKDEALSELQTEKKKVEDLTRQLNAAKTVDQVKDKVKAYAEKHGMPEEAAMDMVLLLKDTIQPDADTRSVLEESKTLIQKQKANDAFNDEFSALASEIPEAGDLREKIRAEAYKEGNLSKSLYEIYHRLNKAQPVKKKTGESLRGAPGREIKANTFDLKAVAEKVKSGQSGALNGLTGEQQDQVFGYLDKQGSRYQ